MFSSNNDKRKQNKAACLGLSLTAYGFCITLPSINPKKIFLIQKCENRLTIFNMHIHTVEEASWGRSSRRTVVAHIIPVQLWLFPHEARGRSSSHQLLHLYLFFSTNCPHLLFVFQTPFSLSPQFLSHVTVGVTGWCYSHFLVNSRYIRRVKEGC